jgi:hypothetical protein
MPNIFVRSPYYVYGSGVSGSAYATLLISVDGILKYTLKKDVDSSLRVRFEISELLRDFLEVDLFNGSNASTHSELFRYTLQFFNSAGTATTPPVNTSGLFADGYSYFEDGVNWTTERGYMATNSIIYRYKDTQYRVPVDRNNALRVQFYKGDYLDSQVVPSANANILFQYIDLPLQSKVQFKDRVEEDGGVYEDSTCVTAYYDSLTDVDRVDILNDAGETISVKVITISECRYEPVYLFFINRYGAQQGVFFFTKSVESIGVTKENYKRSVLEWSSGTTTYDRYSHTRVDFNTQGNEKILLNTGFVDDSYNSIMKEILLSEQVWIAKDSSDLAETLPVNVNTQSLTYKTGVNDKLVDYQLEVSYSYDAIQNIR